MTQRIRSFVLANKDIIIYIFFGALTTLVNLAVYYPLYNFTSISATLCNGIAWIVSVAFSFLTNKPFVFNSHDWSAKTLIPELLKFIGCRIASGTVESLIILVSVDILGWDGNIWKIITGAVVIILNYIGSRFIVFKK